jgi:ABC-type dipeptide/oligopeptide/nickel transport system permease component
LFGSYVLGRVAATVPVLLGISVLVFTLLRLTPGDPAIMIAGPQATDTELQQVRKSLGLDQPIPVQFVFWFKNAVQGDLGRSSQLGVPVAPLVLARFGNTAVLALASLAVALVIAIPAGIISAIKRRSPLDHSVMTLTLLANCMPPFWTGLMLIIVFASTLRWLPTGGMNDVLNPGGAPDVARHLILPAITLGLPATAMIARMMRSSMLDILTQEHLRTARAKGLLERVVIQRHAVKLALLPVLTVVGIRFGYLLGGAAITETVFNWPGVGLQLFQAIGSRDYAFIQGATLMVATIFVVVNLGIDLLYATVDPRIRYR